MSPIDVNLTTCTISDATKIISDKTFSNCNKLTSVVIPQSVTSIGNIAFSSCRALETIIMGDSVRRIGSGAFAGCNLLKYNVKDNLMYLGNQANPYMVLVGVTDSNLESYTIDQNTKIICDKAFNNCKVMTSIVISDAVIFRGEFVFAYCELLETINCKATEQPSDWNSEWTVGTSAQVVWGYKD